MMGTLALGAQHQRLALEVQSFGHLVEHVGLALWDLR
jgi:hypothetical protein